MGHIVTPVAEAPGCEGHGHDLLLLVPTLCCIAQGLRQPNHLVTICPLNATTIIEYNRATS
jgi:hypothetical protein